MMDEDETPEIGEYYGFEAIGNNKSKQFILLLKVAISNWILLALCVTTIYLANSRVTLFFNFFQNMNHILHPVVITVTVLFFVFTITGIVLGKFFRINSWILYIPYKIVFLLAL